MSADIKIWDTVLLSTDDGDYVKDAVDAWRVWITNAMSDLDKVEMKTIKLLAYFSIIEMMAQEYEGFPTKHLQNSFTMFVLQFQNKYDFLDLTDPVTLYYRLEARLPEGINLNDLIDGSVYHPQSSVIRSKVLEIQKFLIEVEGEENSSKRLRDHRYVDLLYRMRCRLSHEFSASHMSYKRDAKEPYYAKCLRHYVHEESVVNDDVWQLSFPVDFIKELCLNCFENYLNYCLETRTLPNANDSLGRFCELSWYSKP